MASGTTWPGVITSGPLVDFRDERRLVSQVLLNSDGNPERTRLRFSAGREDPLTAVPTGQGPTGTGEPIPEPFSVFVSLQRVDIPIVVTGRGVISTVMLISLV